MNTPTPQITVEQRKKIRSLSLDRIELRRLVDTMQERSLAAAEIEVSNFQKRDQAEEIFEANKKTLREGFVLFLTVTGSDGVNLYGTIETVFSSPNFPNDKSKGMGHNLPALWKASFERGLLPNSAPPWISSLNEFHDFPYFIRYKSSIAFYSLPARTLLLKNVSDLIALTNSHVTR